MDNSALIDSFTEFKDFKKIDRLTLTAILEEVFRTALKKKYGTDDNFNIVVNPDKGDLQIWRNRIVVEDGQVEDPAAQIPLSEARKIQDDFEVGEEVSEEVKIMELGRRRSSPCVRTSFPAFLNTTTLPYSSVSKRSKARSSAGRYTTCAPR